MSNQFYTTPKKTGNGVIMAIVIPVVALIAFIVGVVGNSAVTSSKTVVQPTPIMVTQPAQTVTVPGPTVTVTVQATQQAVSKNVQILQQAWANMSETDKAEIRAGWRQYKDNPSTSAVYVTTFTRGITSVPTLTEAEARVFLDWILTN